ncbi:hypothetical protein AZE42_10667, partial [Rhizopogon vesiculosus]
MVDPIAE